MSTPSDAWVPVPLRWRNVVAGDVFFSEKTRDLWLVVEGLDLERMARGVRVAHGATEHTAKVDPDDVIAVLVPVPERDALRLCRDELGARVLERRTATASTTATTTDTQ